MHQSVPLLIVLHENQGEDTSYFVSGSPRAPLSLSQEKSSGVEIGPNMDYFCARRLQLMLPFVAKSAHYFAIHTLIGCW